MREKRDFPWIYAILLFVGLIFAVIGIYYSFDGSWKDEIRNAGFEEGHEKGYEEGYNQGYSDGIYDGYADAYWDGYSDGYDDGYRDGMIGENYIAMPYSIAKDYFTKKCGTCFK